MIGKFLLGNWHHLALAASVVAVFTTVTLMRGQIAALEAEVKTAQANEELARSAAEIEKGNATRIAEMLAEARADAAAERRARIAAQEERDRALTASRAAGEVRREIITVERARDPNLDLCLAYELPDSVVRTLPFTAPS